MPPSPKELDRQEYRQLSFRQPVNRSQALCFDNVGYDGCHIALHSREEGFHGTRYSFHGKIVEALFACDILDIGLELSSGALVEDPNVVLSQRKVPQEELRYIVMDLGDILLSLLFLLLLQIMPHSARATHCPTKG